ncbi:MAG: class II fumarate hydratase [Actinomycetota bacterium]
MTRTETDTMGTVQVPADRLWGAQTQRSLENFPIGTERMAPEIIHALGLQKQAAALANKDLGTLEPGLADAIAAAAAEVAAGTLDDHFPLVVWQTGSGTQTNMNANEVIANRANQALGAPLGAKAPVHPNDHVNCSQSSNDSFPTVMHVAAALAAERRLLPALEALAGALRDKAGEAIGIVKIGRTHLQDATPLRLSDEIGAWATQVEAAADRIRQTLDEVLELAQGGTAVGSGLNAPPGFDVAFCRQLATLTGLAFRPAADKFAVLAAHDALVALSGAMEVAAVALFKVASDIRLLGSGPRCGLGELVLPANEPGSSIMPGKVNPTQAEALTMVCARVIGNHATVAFAGTQGHLQLNVFKPVIADAVLQSARLLADGGDSFRQRCVTGMRPDRARIAQLAERSLMLVTALSPHIGYDKAAAIAKKAHAEGLTLRQAALDSGWVTGAEFDAWVVPEQMA